jgi:hypothetical protein
MTVVPKNPNGRRTTAAVRALVTGKGTLGMAAVHFVGLRLSKSMVGLLRSESSNCAAPIDIRQRHG